VWRAVVQGAQGELDELGIAIVSELLFGKACCVLTSLYCRGEEQQLFELLARTASHAASQRSRPAKREALLLYRRRFASTLADLSIAGSYWSL
jgi:hypothetical protein